MKFTTRELVLLAVFGALWGVVEITLGSVLKSLNAPFSGVLLAAVGLTIVLTARIFVPKRGSTLFVGVIAMLLKLFSLGGVIIGPMLGIFMEALLAEIALSGLGVSRTSLMLAGALAASWSMAQPFVTGPLFFGRALLDVWAGVIAKAAAALHLPISAAWMVLALFWALHLLAGTVAGWTAWWLGRRLAQPSKSLYQEPLNH
jgi:hypothetical protein